MKALVWTLAAAVEVGLLVAVGFAGFALGDGSLHSWLAALASAGVIIALWGLFAAPKAPHRLRGAALLGFKMGAFAGGALATQLVWGGAMACVFTLLAVAYLVLALRLDML